MSAFKLATEQQLPVPFEQQQVPAVRSEVEHPHPLADADVRPSGMNEVPISTAIWMRDSSFTNGDRDAGCRRYGKTLSKQYDRLVRRFKTVDAVWDRFPATEASKPGRATVVSVFVHLPVVAILNQQLAMHLRHRYDPRSEISRRGCVSVCVE